MYADALGPQNMHYTNDTLDSTRLDSTQLFKIKHAGAEIEPKKK